MRYLQIIVLCEGESDAIYLDRIFKILKEKNSDINLKFTAIPTKGKANFENKKYLDKVKNAKLKFQGESQVLYVVDTDDIDTSKEDSELLKRINRYVIDQNWHFVFFNRDIEDVLNKKANRKKKTNEARSYSEKKFNEVDKNNLKVKNYFTRGTSNLFSVISKELGIKI
ncbi:hypothetical protein HUW76_08990 [Fusobacterium animalis]|uniref:Uncharacterized protein n=1 Tax=Fusobacterium animalis 4_8 TaxID=469607 RepID=R9RD90_9FUSO|nr:MULTISPECIES: hypothetical protein [Fusobacterium]AGM24229.1 hypothetical protein HMPREF0409_01611 [Fusobacterium animalis 4_8]EEW94734.2 hypothetical protein HMPREF0406_01257 [Fusobacterium animalis 3_1_33]MCG6844231.1 hypothetical protein [Fusobacterium nucleatum]